jgi:hypothetical protein
MLVVDTWWTFWMSNHHHSWCLWSLFYTKGDHHVSYPCLALDLPNPLFVLSMAVQTWHLDQMWNANITLSSWKQYHNWYFAIFFLIFTNANIFKHPMMFKIFWISMSNYGRIWCDNCKDIKTRLKTFCTSSFLESFDSSINVSILTLENFNASNSHWNLFLPFSRTWYFRGESCHIYLPIEFWITSLRWLAFPIKSIIIFSRKMELMWNSNLVENVYG